MNAARLVMPALRWNDLSGFRHEDQLIASALEVGVGGFIIFGGTAEAVRELTAKLIRDAGRHLLIASDLERGAGQQFDGLTQLPPPRALAALDQLSVTRWAGAMTAREARAIGVNWVFAPVADLDLLPSNPIVQTRAFAAEPELASRHVAAWIEGCQGQGALACAKHYPGHGRTSADSHSCGRSPSRSRKRDQVLNGKCTSSASSTRSSSTSWRSCRRWARPRRKVAIGENRSETTMTSPRRSRRSAAPARRGRISTRRTTWSRARPTGSRRRTDG